MSTMHLPGVYIRRLPEISHQPNVLLPSTTAMQTKDAIVFEVAQYNCVWDHCHRKSQGKWAWESRCPTSQLITSQKLHLHILTSTAFVFQHLLTLGRIWREMFFSRFSERQKPLFFSRRLYLFRDLSGPSLQFQPVLPQNPQGSMILSVELSGYLCYRSLPHANSQKLPCKIWLLRDLGIQQLCMWHPLHTPCCDEAAICEKLFYLECHWAAGTRNS